MRNSSLNSENVKQKNFWKSTSSCAEKVTCNPKKVIYNSSIYTSSVGEKSVLFNEL